jgi:hypothetical protein
MPHLDDPRWEGQDSQSLPDRPAHPDPSRRAEFGDPKETPSHGIYGFLDQKHGLVSARSPSTPTVPAARRLDRRVARGREGRRAGPRRRGRREGQGPLKQLDSSSLSAAKKDAKGAPDEEKTLERRDPVRRGRPVDRERLARRGRAVTASATTSAPGNAPRPGRRRSPDARAGCQHVEETAAQVAGAHPRARGL